MRQKHYQPTGQLALLTFTHILYLLSNMRQIKLAEQARTN